MMKHKGYIGKVVFDDEANIFHGEVVGIRDVITFQGRSVEELNKAFVDSVDDYLAFCEERQESPDKPYSGKFGVRITPELHRYAVMAAEAENETLNSLVTEAIEEKIKHTIPGFMEA